MRGGRRGAGEGKARREADTGRSEAKVWMSGSVRHDSDGDLRDRRTGRKLAQYGNSGPGRPVSVRWQGLLDLEKERTRERKRWGGFSFPAPIAFHPPFSCPSI